MLVWLVSWHHFYIWTAINVILAAMQLEFSAQQLYGAGDEASLTAFAAVGRWASIAILVVAAVVAALSVLLILLLNCVRYMEQLMFTLKNFSKKQRKVERDDED